MDNVVIEGKKIFTIIPEGFDDRSIYGEKVIKRANLKMRTWNPYRSKLSAALLLDVKVEIRNNYTVLYLGAATGTTVSHLSDIVYNGTIYAVEISPFPTRKLLDLCRIRKNVIPIMEDANHPERYFHIVPKVDVVYQDIAQRNQVEIFIKNCEMYLKEDKKGIIMVKSRSIDTVAEPVKVYNNIMGDLKKRGYKIEAFRELNPYARDHACIVVRKGIT